MASPNSINELQGDVKELELLLNHVSRSNVRQIIVSNISIVKAKIEELEKQQQDKVAEKPTEKTSPSSKSTLYTTKITNYGFDEGKKFVKLYVTIPKIDLLNSDQITCDFKDTSVKFIAQNHQNKNHMLQIMALAYPIVPSESWCKIKNGSVVIAMKKLKEEQTWGSVTAAVKKAKDDKDAKLDPGSMDSSDPQAGIMNMMKKMYDEGDDDMKRMIKKTWYESQQKQKNEGLGMS